jgi:hypothetical protein
VEPSLVIPRGPIATDLVFYYALKYGSASNHVGKPLDGDMPRNFGEQTHTVEINDIRGIETWFLKASALPTMRKSNPHITEKGKS